jgi:hypothetical protein
MTNLFKPSPEQLALIKQLEKKAELEAKNKAAAREQLLRIALLINHPRK